jgi:hypothetical protein
MQVFYIYKCFVFSYYIIYTTTSVFYNLNSTNNNNNALVFTLGGLFTQLLQVTPTR